MLGTIIMVREGRVADWLDATGLLELVVEHGLPVTLWIGYNVLDSPMRDE